MLHQAGQLAQHTTNELFRPRTQCSFLPFVFALVDERSTICSNTFHQILVMDYQTSIEQSLDLCEEKQRTVLLIQPTVNVALRSKLLSTFFRPAHTWRQYANSFSQKTLKWAPSSGGQAAELQRTADFLATTDLRI